MKYYILKEHVRKVTPDELKAAALMSVTADDFLDEIEKIAVDNESENITILTTDDLKRAIVTLEQFEGTVVKDLFIDNFFLKYYTVVQFESEDIPDDKVEEIAKCDWSNVILEIYKMYREKR